MEEILRRYIQHGVYKNRTADTLRTYKNRIGAYLKYPVEQWPDVYFEKLRGRRAITSARELTDLNVFFKWAISAGYLKQNPFEHVPKPEIGQILPQPLSRKYAQAILAAASNIDLRAKVVYSTFLYTGIRRSELLKLEEHHVDFDGSLWIRQGKHKKDRMVPLNRELLDLLRYWKKERWNHRFFFCLSLPVLKRMKDRVQASSHKHSIHQLRHTFASLSLESGMDLKTLQKILGHSKLETTAKYLETSVDHMRSQVDKLSFF